MWVQLLNAPFSVREKTKANRYISFDLFTRSTKRSL
jgi:hypothetical protein